MLDLVLPEHSPIVAAEHERSFEVLRILQRDDRLVPEVDLPPLPALRCRDHAPRDGPSHDDLAVVVKNASDVRQGHMRLKVTGNSAPILR
jgi:hypothetical protein